MNPLTQCQMQPDPRIAAAVLTHVHRAPVNLRPPGTPESALIPDYPFDPCYGHYPNRYDQCTWREQAAWRQIMCAGGLKRLCCRVGTPMYESPPWIVMPPNGERFQVTETVALPAINTDTVVVSYRVPLGWDGVINGLVDRVIGVGFIEGSGYVYWRIRSNLRFFKDYGAISTSLGDLTNPCTLYGGGYRIYSGQNISYLVNLTAAGQAAIDPNALILCSLSGWIYPRA